MTQYLVCAVKEWNRAAFNRRAPKLPGTWTLFTEKDELSEEALREISPRYIFFPHWSWKVPSSIADAYECVCFHMTDLPYGRGGSPLQNLIVRGHTDTVVSALRMIEELDAGPLYLKRPLSLSGRAQDIYEACADIVFDMVDHIVRHDPKPVAQEGEPVLFERRRPAQSILPTEGSLEQLYNHIRMLDAEAYPPAVIDYGDWVLEFRNARITDKNLHADIQIKPKKDDS